MAKAPASMTMCDPSLSHWVADVIQFGFILLYNLFFFLKRFAPSYSQYLVGDDSPQ